MGGTHTAFPASQTGVRGSRPLGLQRAGHPPTSPWTPVAPRSALPLAIGLLVQSRVCMCLTLAAQDYKLLKGRLWSLQPRDTADTNEYVFNFIKRI